MFGNFQKTQLRIEIDSSAKSIAESLLYPAQLQKWLPSGNLSLGMPDKLYSGYEFTSQLGPVQIHHYVDVVGDNCLRLLLSQGIDGFHEWYWGEGWVQSRLEGVSVLPLSLGQTASLISLRQFLRVNFPNDQKLSS
ncbi:hypothetical protein [Calothrix sp. NIES-3974]|uniref:hypothetical protein n=1 Tax=Calothrix sp. NIES-3974 TaxID=2005462 RepID=UPI000B5E4FEF|nr:hypothetical protein [Calothrix sp. NIES-3974]BAZ06974.1 hypothetical protein NIES3974_36360 [Calothrix sp. NIES-3974]